MAAVVESVALPSTPHAFRRSSSRPAATVPVSSFPGDPRVGLLPKSGGLSVSRRPARLTPAAASSRSSRIACRGAVVCEASETTAKVTVVTKSTWQSLVIKSHRMALVSFWAPWCGPCRVLHPVIAEIAAEYSGKLNCFELNTDESPDVATQYGIRSIPTVMFFKNGEKKDVIIGAVPKGTLVAAVEKFL